MKKVLIALFLTLFFLFGCSTPEKVARLEGQGPVRIYNAPYAKTWKAAVDSAWNVGLTVLRVYPEQGFISAKRGMSATSFGEDVAIWLKEAGPGRTQVEVVSRQKGVPMLEIKHWEETMFQTINQEIGGNAMAQGSAPGVSGQTRSSLSDSTYVSGLPVQVSLPTVQAAPVTKPFRIKNPEPDEVVLHQKLQTHLESREQELKKESDPARRKLLESEIDYLRDEVSAVESRIASSGK